MKNTCDIVGINIIFFVDVVKTDIQFTFYFYLL